MKRTKRCGRIPLIGDMIFSVLSLPMTLGAQEIVDKTPDSPEFYGLFLSALCLMGIARLFRAFRYRGKSRFQFIRYIAYGVILIGCVPLAYALYTYENPNMLMVLGSVYWGLLILNRVFSIIRKHSLRNILLNILALFLLVIVYSGFIMNREVNDFIYVTMFFAMFQALLSIMTVAFARINLRVLGSVIRQSYATEILLGLALLIVSFSYCLRTWEPGMASLGDAMWYCFAIVTTIGFGDIAAVTLKGRVLSVILGMYGIVVVALITSIIVNFYGEMKRENAQEDK